jgi:cytochrome c oxidase cbb3-type subunit I
VVQSIGSAWFADGIYSLWLVPLALAGAYFVVPKVSGRALPSYEAAPLAFWILIIVGTWTGCRHLVGGPVPAWVPTMAVVGYSMLLYHYVVIALNLRIAFGAPGTAVKFVQFGLVAYLVSGLWAFAMAFRSVAAQVQFTFVTTAQEQLSFYGAVSMFFFGAIYFMVPRLTGRAWASGALVSGHMAAVMLGVAGSVAALALAGAVQSSMLMDAKVTFPEIFHQLRTPLLLNSAAQLLLLSANLLLLVNFCRTACVCCEEPAVANGELFRRPSGMEASVS